MVSNNEEASTAYSMTLSLNVLNHLGINLYSNVPAILAEVVANAWDADARHVSIDIAADGSTIVIVDDGHGMTQADINKKFLFVGYQRREAAGEAVTPELLRPVMGRKGIGKLSLFSIAEEIEVQSARDGETNGFIMNLAKIRDAIKSGVGTYNPDPLDPSLLVVSKGTRITLGQLRKKVANTEKALRRRLARRFSIIGPEYQFAVSVNGVPIGPTDRDYYHKLQYLWHYGPRGEVAASFAKKLDKSEHRDVPNIDGWIGSVRAVGSLKDDSGESLNRIVVMVRGKLAQEDLLESFGEGGVYTKYLMGEIYADFLDVDDEEDIATSSRQSVIEDDPRYQEMKQAVHGELKYIQNQWTKYRNEEGTEAALQLPAIKEWFGHLGKDDRQRAEALFGKINQLTFEEEDQRRTLFKHGVLAFESLRYKQNLAALEDISLDNLALFSKIFGHIDDMEATLYHQIIAARIHVVRALQQKVEENVLEKVIQEHLFDHLWLLDPAWERATGTEYMEQRVATEFNKIDAKLTEAEKKSRIDLKYRKTGGRHVIIELKRAGISLDTDTLLPQIRKYRNALQKLLNETGAGHEAMDIICVVGRELTDWTNDKNRQISENQFKELDARVVLYQELIESAYRAYREYLEKSKEAGRIFSLIATIDQPPDTVADAG